MVRGANSADGLSRRTGGPPLSREAVLAAALEIGDAEGLESVSMRTLVGRFVCTPWVTPWREPEAKAPHRPFPRHADGARSVL